MTKYYSYQTDSKGRHASSKHNHTPYLLRLALSVVALTCMTSISAQQKSFTLEDLIPGGKTYTAMQPANLKTVWWGDKLMRLDPETCYQLNERHDWTPLLQLHEVKDALRADHLDVPDDLSLKSAAFPDAKRTEVLFVTSRLLFSYDWKRKCITKSRTFDSPISWQDYSSASGYLAYNQDNNLYIAAASHRKPIQLSHDGSREIVYGQSVHRDEFGISKGTFWSPDGRKLCFYRMDQSMVADYPLVDISTRIATVQPIKYPMAGETSHKVSMGVYDLSRDRTVWLQTGDNTDQYYACISWTPDSKHILLYNINRDQNHARLLEFNAKNGKLERVLMEVRHPKYVEPQHPLTFLPWDSDKFIYWSQQSGYDNLYLYSLSEGRTLRCVTEGHQGVVVDFLGFNTATRSIIVNTTWASPIQHNLYSVSLDNGTATPLDNGEGVHRAMLSEDGSHLVDTWSSPSMPRSTDIVNTGNATRVTLLASYSQWSGYKVPDISCGTLKAADGTTDLYYRLIKPTDFDSTKRYPAVVYVYGGPHARNVLASWGYAYRGWEIYMAQRGYVVFVLDNRGSSERGRDFENVIFRHLGTEEMKDQMRGVDLLKSLPYVDSTRLGVHGWSYGGFMTINLMLTHPETFKCGVAGGPVIDWSYYEVMYGERYMDRPQDNPEGYRANNLRLRAGNLKGRLLVIFGYNDPTCVPQHTLSFIRACETAGTHPDLLTYPGDGHNMFGRDRVHLHEQITRYFEDHLK